MNWKKTNRWLLPILFVLILLAMQATMLAAAKPVAAPLAITDTPTQQVVVITDTPTHATPHPKKTSTPEVYYPPDYRPRPGGPGNLDTVLLSGLLVIGGLAVVAVLWFIPRWNRRKG
jgi:hypothetical protein